MGATLKHNVRSLTSFLHGKGQTIIIINIEFDLS